MKQKIAVFTVAAVLVIGALGAVAYKHVKEASPVSGDPAASLAAPSSGADTASATPDASAAEQASAGNSTRIFLIGGYSTDPADAHALPLSKQIVETYGGVGIGFSGFLGAPNGGPFIVSDISPGSAASKADIMVGDQLVSVDGKDLSGDSIMQVVGLLRGTVGTGVDLSLVRNPSGPNRQAMQIHLVRAELTAPTTYSVADELSFNRPKNYVWSSADMSNWTLSSPDDLDKWQGDEDPENLNTTSTRVVSMGSKIFVFGRKFDLSGTAAANPASVAGLWVSSSGSSWKLVASSFPWNKTEGNGFLVEFSPFALGNTLFAYVSKNDGSNSMQNSVWTSPDGVTWKEHAAPSLDGYMGYLNQPVLFDGKLWMWRYKKSGGFALVESKDGIAWSEAPKSKLTQIFSNNGPDFLVPFNGYLYMVSMLGADTSDGSPSVFRSKDGASWEDISGTFPVQKMFSSSGTTASYAEPAGLFSFGGKLWYVSRLLSRDVRGEDMGTSTTSVWSTTDGTTWTKAPASSFLSKRQGYMFATQ